MSRAFIKEDGPDTAPLPDLPISPHPNYVTPLGLAQLQSRFVARQADLDALKARADRLDAMPEKAAERDIRYLDARLRSAIVIDSGNHPAGIVAFGHRVTVLDEDGAQHIWQIVGEDEADANAGKISLQSPLARALIGAEIGDQVSWRRAGQVQQLEILDIK